MGSIPHSDANRSDFHLSELVAEIDRLLEWLVDDGGFPTGIPAFDRAWILVRRETENDPKHCLLLRRLVTTFRTDLRVIYDAEPRF